MRLSLKQLSKPGRTHRKLALSTQQRIIMLRNAILRVIKAFSHHISNRPKKYSIHQFFS